MTLRLDYIVIHVQDLPAAIADYRSLGFTVVPGGQHADGATHNALIAFADGTYLELLAFLRPAPEHRWDRFQTAGEGLIDFALLPDDITAAAETARRRGLSLDGPFDGGRVRPDGQAIAWQTAVPKGSGLPFLCADRTPRSLRVPHPADQPGAWRHRNGALGVAGVTIAVADLDARLMEYRALLGADPTCEPLILPGFGVRLATFAISPATITLAQALRGAEAVPAVDLARCADGPFAVALVGADFPGPLDLAQAHGARVELRSGKEPAG